MLVTIEKEWAMATCNHTGESQIYFAKWKQPDLKAIVLLRLYKVKRKQVTV